MVHDNDFGGVGILLLRVIDIAFAFIKLVPQITFFLFDILNQLNFYIGRVEQWNTQHSRIHVMVIQQKVIVVGSSRPTLGVSFYFRHLHIDLSVFAGDLRTF